MEFIDPGTTSYIPVKSRGELTHLYKPACCYFVTFRLADAVLPRARREQVIPTDGHFDPAELMADYEPPITLGACALRRPEIAAIVQNALLHFNEQRYQLLSWCVMPNHVRANEVLGMRGAFWERESFDHLIRTAEDVERFVRYVEENPVVAALCGRCEDWPYSSAGMKFQSPLAEHGD